MFQQLPPLLDYAFLSAPDSPETFIISRSGAVRHWQEGIGNGLPVKRREQTLPTLFVMENVSSSKWQWRKNYLPILEVHPYTLFAVKDGLLFFCQDHFQFSLSCNYSFIQTFQAPQMTVRRLPTLAASPIT